MDTVKPKANKPKPPTPGAVVTLKELCVELKVDAREARERLRLAVRDPKKYNELKKAHQPGATWEWAKGSLAEKEARALLSE